MLKLLVVVVVVAAAATDLDTEWTVFKAKYNKKYNTEIENVRKNIWIENKKFIEEHNTKFKLGLSSYYLGENEYADMMVIFSSCLFGFSGLSLLLYGCKTWKTNSELVSKVNGLKVEQNIEQKFVAQKGPQVNHPPSSNTVDWRKKGYVTPVKNQGECACSWAFSATGSMEGQYFASTGKLVSLSESNLVDCSRPYGNRGCLYGTMDISFSYAMDYGIESEATYPYTPVESPCKYNKSNIVTKFSAYSTPSPNTEIALQYFVTEFGPMSAGIDGSHPTFKLYKGGIYNEPNCSSIDLNHGVLVVGYGSDHGGDYWIVKNSWGTSWGEKGYIRMTRNKFNQCGIATMASYPNI